MTNIPSFKITFDFWHQFHRPHENQKYIFDLIKRFKHLKYNKYN